MQATSISVEPKRDLLRDYVTKHTLAVEFGVSTRTIERWVRLRLLPAPVRLGRTSLYHLPTIWGHLENQEKRTPRRRSQTLEGRGHDRPRDR